MHTQKQEKQKRKVPRKKVTNTGAASKYTPQMIKKVSAALKKGMTYKYAAELAGISETTFYDYMHKHPEFSEAVKASKAANAQYCMDRIVELADERKDPRAYQWILANGHRDQYHTKQETEIQGGDKPVKIEVSIDLS